MQGMGMLCSSWSKKIDASHLSGSSSNPAPASKQMKMTLSFFITLRTSTTGRATLHVIIVIDQLVYFSHWSMGYLATCEVCGG